MSGSRAAARSTARPRRTALDRDLDRFLRIPAEKRRIVESNLISRVKLVSPATIEKHIQEEPWLNTAWDMANLLFGSIGLRPLGRYRRVLGFCPGNVCYVSLDYLRDDDPFADYVVHETAHVLHNTRREALGLARRRARERLVDVDFRKRETLAYGCEFYSRIAAGSADRRERIARFAQWSEDPGAPDHRVDPAELRRTLEVAVTARNGWERIRLACR